MIELATPAPIGIGTPHCESLSSYVQRVAEGNGTFPGQLVHRLLGWIAQSQSSNAGSWCAHPKRVLLGRNINAFGYANAWIETLGRVLDRVPLESLVANRWADAFPSRGLLTATMRWCSCCLREDGVPYHRLVWALQAVEYCELHKRTLARRCPRCRRPPPVLHDRSLVLICARCSADLREAGQSIVSHETFEPVELGKIIAHFSRADGITSWSSGGSIRMLATSCGLSNSNQLRKAIGASKLSAWGWWQGANRISLPLAYHAHYRLGASFAEAVISGTVQKMDATEQRQTVMLLGGRRTARLHDWIAIARRLRAITRCPLAQAPTFLAAAQEIGIERRTLRQHCPDLCRTIARRSLLRADRERRRRDAQLTRDLRRALIKAMHAGKDPRQHELERIMGRPGLFNSRYARLALAALLTDQANAAPSP